MGRILQAADLYDRPELGEPYQNAETIIRLKRRAGRTVPDPAPRRAGDPDVTARIDHGRWLGDCGLDDPATGARCANAQAVDESDRRWFCIACHNAALGGRWRRVAWPAEIADVEAPLGDVAAPQQHWPVPDHRPDPDPPIQGED